MGQGRSHQDRGATTSRARRIPRSCATSSLEQVGRDRFESDLPRALELYLEELERQLAPRTRSSRSPASRSCSRAWPRSPGVTLAPPDREPRARRAAEARAARLQPLLPVRRLRQRLGRPVPAAAGRGRARARAHGPAFRRQVGRHRRRLDPRRRVRARLGVRAVAVATGITSPERLAAEKPDALMTDFADTERALEAIVG